VTRGRGRTLAILVVIVGLAASRAWAQTDRRPVMGRLAGVLRAQQWAEAVNAHVAGRDDDAARTIAAWSPANLADLEIEARAIATLIRNPRARTFLLPMPGERIVPRTVVYSDAERDILHGVATATTGGDRLLARGVILHTDIAIGIVRAAPVSPATQGSAAIVSYADGHPLATSRFGDHWRTARALLDLLRQRKELDPLARDWYRATLAALQHREQWNVELTGAALQRFPGDPDLLFLAGSFHEAMASPPAQHLAHSALPRGVDLGIKSPRDERRLATDLLKRAMEKRQDFAEARLHLGRLLTYDGKYAEAVSELTRARAATADLTLQYYADLFLGDAQEQSQRFAEALESYRRAQALFPSAQSPALAIAALLAGHGDQAGALAAVQAHVTNERAAIADPWLTYSLHPGRDGDAWLADVTRRLQQVPPPQAAPDIAR
jgi:tetratricopeptide (TPR) repeat protein